jgi:hypothetical protein
LFRDGAETFDMRIFCFALLFCHPQMHELSTSSDSPA